jgi:ribosomal protein S12 methylthiotransferase accessory factor
MPRTPLTDRWYASPFTGLFARHGPVPPRPYDPDVCAWSGTMPRWGPGGGDLTAGGAGWDEAAALGAAVGEAVERWQPRSLVRDETIEAAYARWPRDEPAVPPGRWVLFHPQQYADPTFPFQPLRADTVCGWVCCREAHSGEPWWLPEALVFLEPREAQCWPFGPVISTGLSCGRDADTALLRGLQEVIERDAVVGAWWGAYPMEEHDCSRVFAALSPTLPPRLRRPNLSYRCYRIRTPLSAHVCVVSLEGEDREGYVFSIGSACRETRTASWEKALLEAVQGRHYVRYLKAAGAGQGGPPADFAAHAVYYSYHPDELARTVLDHAMPAGPDAEEATVEALPQLAERLGKDRPVLFRNLTPPALAIEDLGWVVLRVLVPGLQPLYGHHAFPFLGGPLWGERPLAQWADIPPHPYP